MRRELSHYWCPSCKRLVVEAIPKAAVWCPCGRRAVEIPASGKRPAPGGQGRQLALFSERGGRK